MKRLSSLAIVAGWFLGWFVLSAAVWAATPTAEQALKLTPVQPGVDYDRPTPEQAARCKIVAKRIDGHMGWIVESPEGVVLRKFVDTNDDKVVDQWSYFKDGLEVYRDSDTKHTGRVDQYRWFHTGGTRWGLDPEGTGTIQYWKQISPEEVTAEIVAALATQDNQRFVRLVITPAELRSLGLGRARAESVAQKARHAVTTFSTMAARQTTIGRDAVWTQFSAGRPGVVPAGTDQSTKDLRVYENVMAIADSGGKHVQVLVGTLVQVGDAWRVIDLPQPMVDGQADATPSGFFFAATLTVRNDAAETSPSEALQKLLAELENLDREAAANPPADPARFMVRRAALLEQIAAAAKTADERGVWLRQLADMLSAGAQAGTCPDGIERLKALLEKLESRDTDKNVLAYVKFRLLTTSYVLSMQAAKADTAKIQAIQAKWLKTLEGFVADYPAAPDAAEAMLQLAISQEFSGQEDEAKRWYSRIVADFPAAPAGRKAAGALTRLDCVGRTIAVAGPTPSGRPIDISQFRGKIVLVQYWTTNSPAAKADMATLKEMWNKYGKSLAIVGVSLDGDVKDLNAYLADNPLPWPQIFEEGGLDSQPANSLGILTIPTMILLDQDGKVVNRNVSTTELEAEIKKLLR
jgi:hypothetical protein